MGQALISLGANLGDRAATLDRAIAALGALPDVRRLAYSSWQETPPVGGPAGQPAFLNGAMLLETSLSPRELLNVLQAIEQEAGRRREERWGARTLDLDLLLYDEVVLDEPDLTLPHPRMAYRRFVLAPAAEAAPEMRHPLIGWTVARLLRHLDQAPNYLAVTGPPGAGKTRLAQLAAEATGATFCCDPRELLAERARDDEISLARDRAAGVAAALGDSPAGVISDFWIEQAIAYGNPMPEDLFAQAPKAKLVAFLAPRSVGRSEEPLVEKLRRLATRPGRGPYLLLNSDDFENAVAETAAAMLAMR